MKRSPIRQMSKKRRLENVQRKKMLRETFGENPMCVVCGGPADDAHEVLSRAQGGSITDPANILPLCRGHHEFATNEPKLAAEAGLRESRKWSAL